jgi:hypothetical protein
MTVTTEVEKAADDDPGMNLGLAAPLDEHGVDGTDLFDRRLTAPLLFELPGDLAGLGDPGRRGAEDDLVPVSNPVDKGGHPVNDKDYQPEEQMILRRGNGGGVITGVLAGKDLPEGTVGQSANDEGHSDHRDDDSNCVPDRTGSLSCEGNVEGRNGLSPHLWNGVITACRGRVGFLGGRRQSRDDHQGVSGFRSPGPAVISVVTIRQGASTASAARFRLDSLCAARLAEQMPIGRVIVVGHIHPFYLDTF